MTDNKPASLAEILHKLVTDSLIDWKPVPYDEAIAAIEGLVPGKLEPRFDGDNYRWQFIQGYNQAIDTIRHNFKGENND